MKEKLELILNGDYDRELDALSFSCPLVELVVQPGREAEGSFRIYGPSSVEVLGKFGSFCMISF